MTLSATLGSCAGFSTAHVQEAPTTPIHAVRNALSDAAYLASRCTTLADTLLGTRPENNSLPGPMPIPNGVFPDLQDQSEYLRQSLGEAHEALRRIENAVS
ncbi:MULTISPECIES: hypothetical protein [unclassified Aurantimonas]|uniref:hypothetical protein n=1 Tax=unclassified Aurantimonas TaxID=2638230 RepID=UPI002E193C14|nr:MULTISPECIES: hypothetical protein [unclassified Aurantimonas]MEC5291552.1 hypothetical protein [Aurantimonas sp. C2-3-R2]MEC5412636.1 hypothetical protein [Aurantimonas sp. C2-4-R8]